MWKLASSSEPVVIERGETYTEQEFSAICKMLSLNPDRMDLINLKAPFSYEYFERE